MIRRSKEQWLTLFNSHQQSGLSAAEFCSQHKLCPKYFSLRRRQLAPLKQKPLSSFVRAEPVVMKPHTPQIVLQGTFGELSLAGSVSPDWLGKVLKQLL